MTAPKPAPVIPYAAAVERAKAWLGTRYLLARPVNVLPGLLRRQA